MALDPAVARAREAALDAAVRLRAVPHLTLSVGAVCSEPGPPALDSVRADAEVLTAWLLGTAHLTISRGPVVSQATGQPTGTPNQGDPMQLHDDEKVALTVDTKDAKGFETADAVTWTIDDGSVASLSVSDDGRSCEVVAGSPGSAVITVADDAAGLSVTEAIDVVAAGTATISIGEGTPEKQ